MRHLLSLVLVCAGALLSACGGGGSDDPGTVTPALAGQTFGDGFLNGSSANASYTTDGTMTFKVNDSAGAATGTTTINGVTYPLTGTVSPTDKSVRLSFSTATGSGSFTGRVLDQTGFWGFTGTFDITIPFSGSTTPVRFTGYASADTLPSGGGGGGAGGSTGGLAGTWCADVSGNQNCWYFDNNTGSSTGTFYQQSINQYAGTLTNTMTWSANTSAKTLTYRFTRSTLTNSASNYDQAVNGSTYTFGYTLTATAFTFQNIVFNKR